MPERALILFGTVDATGEFLCGLVAEDLASCHHRHSECTVCGQREGTYRVRTPGCDDTGAMLEEYPCAGCLDHLAHRELGDVVFRIDGLSSIQARVLDRAEVA